MRKFRDQDLLPTYMLRKKKAIRYSHRYNAPYLYLSLNISILELKSTTAHQFAPASPTAKPRGFIFKPHFTRLDSTSGLINRSSASGESGFVAGSRCLVSPVWE